MRQSLLRREVHSIHDLLNARANAINTAPFALRRDQIPESFIKDHLPVGWVDKAERWCSKILGPHLPSVGPHPTRDGFAALGPGRHHLFVKSLICPSYLQRDLDPRVRALVQTPPATLVAGLNVLRLTANSLSLYGGQVPTEASLVGLLPLERMKRLADKWSMEEILLFDRPVQLRGDPAALPITQVPPVIVQLVGAVSLMHGPAAAGDLAVAELFPPMPRQAQSAPPLVFL